MREPTILERQVSEARRRVALLNEVEHRVLVEVMSGSSVRAIAEREGCTIGEVEALEREIIRKFGVATIPDIVRIAVYAGVFKIGD